MRIFEYPFVIITILVFIFIIAGAVGIIFAIKGLKNANGTVEKDFISINKLEGEYKKLSEEKSSRCTVYIDIASDTINRVHSSVKADVVLKNLEQNLLLLFPDAKAGGIARYSEESFVVISSMDSNEIRRKLDTLFDMVNGILIKNEAVNMVEVNGGFYVTKATDVTFNTAILRAKQACTIAENKKIPYCEWDNINGKEFEKRIKMENNIHKEIDNNKFFLMYQPIINVNNNEIVGAEVLARLNSETEGIVSPVTFLSAVNSVGLQEKFDYYIFEKNCKWISNDKVKREKYVYTINFSRNTLCEEGFSEEVISIIEKYGLKYSSVAVEILEDKNLTKEEKDMLHRNVSELKKRGVLILLDDFGSGYTSFSDLNHFDVSIVKIDKNIVQNAVNNSGMIILKNIIQTAKELGFKTLCEGIETKEHFETVKNAGCDFVQGYYFYKPMQVQKFEDIME